MRNGKIIKALCGLIVVMLFVTAIYLMIDFGGNSDIIYTYDSVRPDSTSGFSKSLQFLTSYTSMTGDTTLAISAGLSQDVAEAMAENRYDPVTGSTSGEYQTYDSTGHEHYIEKQSNYASVSLGPNGNVSNNGCGLMSHIFVIAELEGKILSPSQFISEFPNTVNAGWGDSRNMKWGAPPAFINEINSKSNFGTYEIVSQGTGVSNSKVMQAIRDYAGQDNTVVMVSASEGLFTGGGHIMCVSDLSTDGQSFHMMDSSSVAARHLSADYATMNRYNFPLYNNGELASGINYNNHYYNYSFKAFWVIRRTV